MGGKILAAIAVGVVACILMAGLYTLWAGGDVSRTWSNKLMRLRVVAQFVAIVILIVVAFIMRQH